MHRLPVRPRLLLLGTLGVLLTLLVAGTALVCLNHVSTISSDLAQVGRAQRFHQDADMMHDALRADVARAVQAGSGDLDVSAARVRKDAGEHTKKFHDDLVAIQRLSLAPPMEHALDLLRPIQVRYIAKAQGLIESALTHPGTADAAEVRYEKAFNTLVHKQAKVTRLLSQTSAQTEQAAGAEKREAGRMIGASSSAALGGWLALILWHRRSMGSLQDALVREAEQRSASDLLQRSLLPRQLPTVPGVELAARSLPGQSGNRVGGDWYDVIGLPSGEVGLVVGDVVGHDLPAATAMGQLRNALRAYALDSASPAQVLRRLNRAAHLLEVADMATCVYAVLDPSTLTVRWSSAGHLPPLVSSAEGAGRLLDGEPDPPLGSTQDASYYDHETQLMPGEAFVLYSDGLVERRGAAIDEGLADLEAVRGPHPSAEIMCDRLLAALLTATHDDDVTLLLAQV